MEEDETDMMPPLVFEQPIMSSEPNNLGATLRGGGPIIEELPTVPENEERAIVLFKPVNNASMFQSPSSYSISVDSNIISGFKNQGLWGSNSNPIRASKDEEEKQDNNLGTTNRNLAVVPWVPSKFPQAAEIPQTNASELMEAEYAEATTMDIEDESAGVNQIPGNEFSGMGGVWSQHCIVPQPPENTSTPIVWFR
ncbi:hypothetical protein LguiB_005643 [Lonicera macranthoides]